MNRELRNDNKNKSFFLGFLFLFQKFTVFLLTFFLLIFLNTSKISASSNFITDYNVTYTVLDSGITKANFKISLTNKTSDFYASSYNVQLGFEDMKNVRVTDPKGTITPVVTKVENGHILDLSFNEKSIGKDSKMIFDIYFETPEIAAKIGKIWEINVPGVSEVSEFNSFNVEIIVPDEFGSPTYVKPVKSDNDLKFSKEELGKSGISLGFGKKQIYNFDLLYHLKNTNLYPIDTEIAIPMTTNYQTVYISNIDPEPIDVDIDKDGNWLAKYKMLPSERKNVRVKGAVEISLAPKEVLLSNSEKKLYTRPTLNWQTENPEIKKNAANLKTPRAIYDYVISSLNYDFKRVEKQLPRLGAAQALAKSDSAVCREFTDLFVAIARSAGIPAREVNGYAYTQNSKQRPLSLIQDILHAWPEYYDYDKKTWVMIDPTWGNTTGGVDYFEVLDFDHFAFAIKGIQDDYPVPAGGYKFEDNKDKKDVSISFDGNIPEVIQSIDVDTNFKDPIFTVLPIRGRLVFINTGSVLIDSQEIVVVSEDLNPSEQKIKINSIPPFGKEEIEISFNSIFSFSKKDARISILIAGVEIYKQIKIIPFYQNIWGVGGVFGGIFTVGLLIFARKAWGLHIFGRKK